MTNKDLELKQLKSENEALRHIITEIHYMSQRYADGRRTFAASIHNDATKTCLRLGIDLPSVDGIIWARDGGGRSFDHLSEEQSTPGTPEALGQNRVVAFEPLNPSKFITQQEEVDYYKGNIL